MLEVRSPNLQSHQLHLPWAANYGDNSGYKHRLVPAPMKTQKTMAVAVKALRCSTGMWSKHTKSNKSEKIF